MTTRLRPDSFEGHDVLIVFGTVSARDMRCIRLLERIRKDDISLVLLVYDGAVENAKAEADALLSALRMLLKSSPIDRLIKTVEYKELCARFPKKRNFAFSTYMLDESMAVPDVCREESSAGFLKVDPKFFDAYVDDEDTYNGLKKATSILANSSTTSSSCVLLTGPSGCGKSFAAETIYEALKAGNLVNGKFVHLNCATLPKEHIDAYLFGIPKGMFTDVKERKGAIENAEDGVLFLDEVGNLPYDAQSHLLTFLDKGVYYAGGEFGEAKRSNCKLVFGTNVDLPQEIGAGRFRGDLYARINTQEVRLPTVASRIKNDADKFLPRMLEDVCRKNGDLKLTANARRRFMQFALDFSWPFNFRDVNRLFTQLRDEVSASNADGIVSASVMIEVIEKFKEQPLPPVAEKSETEVENEPVEFEDMPEGVAAFEMQLLPFIRKVARESKTRTQAGIRFYQGKVLSNYSDSFKKYLDKFGLEFDSHVDGHLRKVAGDPAKEGNGI